MKLYIKFMVSIRCKMIVKSELSKLGLKYFKVELGEAEIEEDITSDQKDKLQAGLMRSGLELMDDRKATLIEKIKNVIVEMVHYSDELPKVKNSEFISKKLNHDYTYLSNIFSEATGITIERFLINHKIERVKELIIYDELNITEIAFKLHYSSVGHLAYQFKKITGLTPSFFKKLGDKRRNHLENL